ncbi:hypothetical protein SDC9_205200 [bioreactor metagenome]|uniref:Uncharacterized protein n=1 Tax=bioreactor metagenome TaxID=1076179 RepID=A0A645J227_9ZZZZ
MQFGDPAGQLDHFEVVLVFLQRRRAEPQQIRQQAPEAAQRHGGENHHRRRIVDLAGKEQIVLTNIAVKFALDQADAGDQHQRNHQRQQIFADFSVFDHLRITNPSSRRQ